MKIIIIGSGASAKQAMENAVKKGHTVSLIENEDQLKTLEDDRMPIYNINPVNGNLDGDKIIEK